MTISDVERPVIICGAITITSTASDDYNTNRAPCVPLTPPAGGEATFLAINDYFRFKLTAQCSLIRAQPIKRAMQCFM